MINEANEQILLTVPNQKFRFMTDNWKVTDKECKLELTEEYKGTIALVVLDENTLIPFGFLERETEGRMAFWDKFIEINEAWKVFISTVKEKENDKQSSING